MREHVTFRRAGRSDVSKIVRMLADDTLGGQRERSTSPLPESYLLAFDAIDRDLNIKLIVAASSPKNELIDDYLPFVEVIHSYETFSNPKFEDPDKIFSRENYELYLKVHARHYLKAFSLGEIEKIAEFFSSEVGAKLFAFHRDADPLAEFLEEVQRRKDQDAEATAWTCPDHPAIRSPEEASCPICRNPLIPEN